MNETTKAALRRHGFNALPASVGTNPSWVRGRRHGNRFVASVTDDDTLVVSSARPRLSGSAGRSGTLKLVSSLTFQEIDRFLYEVRR